SLAEAHEVPYGNSCYSVLCDETFPMPLAERGPMLSGPGEFAECFVAVAPAQQLTAFVETSSVCDTLLQRSLELTGATFGNVQLVDWQSGELKIVSQFGFQPDFLRFFERVKYQDSCACARALDTRAPVVVGDVMSDAGFVPYRDIAQLAGFRAVQST